MSWQLAEAWLTVIGLCLLTIGTGAQAWTSLRQYRSVARKMAQAGLGQLFLTFFTAFSFDPKIFRGKTDDNAKEAARLVRLAAVWDYLVLGSMLVLAGAVIQLVHT